jgi:5-methyltetrahydrofolate--homocysteine methyltransferase
MDLLKYSRDNVLIFDGAMGTSLQGIGDFECNEELNLSRPDVIRGVHKSYFEAGANVVETNTFGANGIVLAEYGLEKEIEKINKTAVKLAREAAEGNGWVAGSIGPSTKMPTLGHVSFDDMAAAYRPQIKALVEAGVDILLVETCQDILQTKIVLITINEVLSSVKKKPCIMVSLTLENNGAMLTGTDLITALSILQPFKPDIIGVNCAFGPKDLGSYIGEITKNFSGLVSFMPNAGTPVLQGGKTVYPESPEEFAAIVTKLVEEYGLDVIGGCCGTTPEHIQLISQIKKKQRNSIEDKKTVSSLYQAVNLRQDPAPLLVGERANATGSRKFREMLLSDNFEDMVSFAAGQNKEGAHIVDVSLSYTGRSEAKDMEQFCALARARLTLPIMIDSTHPDVVESALKSMSGRSIINSVNLEDGGEKLDQICSLASKFRVPVVALTIDEKGMAVDCERKIEIFERLRTLLFEKYGLGDGDVLYDLLTFTVGSGEEKYRYSAKYTLEALGFIKNKYPNVLTVLGVSNVSFGLSKASRPYLNTVFLQLAVERGLDAAIVHSGKIVPHISEDIKKLCVDLLMGEGSLGSFIEYFSDQKEIVSEEKEDDIRTKVLNGDKRSLEEVLEKLLETEKPLNIVNNYLIAAMQEVGDLFREGKMQLPFVLQAAEVMKSSVDYLEQYMDGEKVASRGKLLLGTVAGDVHDIGKNLVKIILENNGYDVIDIGVKVPGNIFIESIHEHKPDVIGMSGLLVQSVQRMLDNLQLMKSANIDLPVLLGGAALTRQFVEDECQPTYNGPVIYCRNAFDGLHVMRGEELKAPRGGGARREKKFKKPNKDRPSIEYGVKTVREFIFEDIEKFLNKEVLFRSRWEFRRGKQSAEQYKKQRQDIIEPNYARIRELFLNKGCFSPVVSYGFFECCRHGDTMQVGDIIFDFPRKELCLSDLFDDVLGAMLVTLGDNIVRVLQEVYSEDNYKDYYLLHGFAVEVTDALAAYTQQLMKGNERFSFGYPLCPDLKDNAKVVSLVDDIGVQLTENYQMVPEFSTGALVTI